MALGETKPRHYKWRSDLHISEDSNCAHFLRGIVNTKGIYDEFTIGWGWWKQGVVAVESHSSDRVGLIVVTKQKFKLLWAYIYDANWWIVATKCNVNWLRRKSDIWDWNSLWTDLQFLNYIAIWGTGECKRATISSTSRNDHVVVTPGESRDLEAFLRIMDHSSRHTIVYLVY